jgi:hypothetical protein
MSRVVRRATSCTAAFHFREMTKKKEVALELPVVRFYRDKVVDDRADPIDAADSEAAAELR